MQYEWDEGKRKKNRRKHGVDFADAVGALEDASGLTVEDELSSDETRYITVGCGLLGNVLYVVWTELGLDVFRIISAREASPGEAHHYRR